MYIKLLLALLFSVCTSAAFADLEVTAVGKSNYQIVVPDPSADPQIDFFLQTDAALLQKCIKQASGATLPIVKESALDKAKSSLFVGATKALAKTGVKTDTLKTWEHRILVKGKDIYIFGQDWHSPVKVTYVNDYSFFNLGTMKAITVFLEKFCSTRFLFPGDEGIVSLKQDRITVPANFTYQKIPAVQYCMVTNLTSPYVTANNFFKAPWYGCYGGHSHPVAIPKDKYEKSNPEYFALAKGKRFVHPTHTQYCLSNPEVQKLIYQEVLDHLDKGYEMVQLAQADGFSMCECEDCAKLYGVKSPGEKLWIMHRDMAVKLLKDRPGKKVCIIAYGPTKTPPETFKEFPDNVVIELAPYSKEILNAWKPYTVKGGFVVYLYNWGDYKWEGFTPRLTPEYLAEQAESFTKNNVKGIYCCGFGELMGLEGPEYYMWGKKLDDPTLSADALLKEYYNYCFGPAAELMSTFYGYLYERVKLDIKRGEDNWNDPALLDGTLPAMHDNCRILAMRYPPDALDKLENFLAEAEAKSKGYPPADAIMPLVRIEFDYLKLTAGMVTGFDEYRKSPDDANFYKLLKSIDARNQFISGLPVFPKSDPPRLGMYKSCRIFGITPVSMLKENGRLKAPLFAPFNWDVQWLQENKINPAGRSITATSVNAKNAEPQYLVQKDLYIPKPVIKEKPVLIQCSWDKKNLYVTFLCRNTTQEAIANDEVQVYIAAGGDKKNLLWLPSRARNGATAIHKLTKTSLENSGKGDEYGPYTSKAKASVSVPAKPVENQASVKFTIPFELLGETPSKGAKWAFNAVYQNYIWEYNLSQKTWRNTRDQQGTIVFE